MRIKEPIKVGNSELKNRLVMPPIATYQSREAEGYVTDAMLDYYGKRWGRQSRPDHNGALLYYPAGQGKSKAAVHCGR